MFLNAEFKATEGHLKGNIHQAIEEIEPKLRRDQFIQYRFVSHPHKADE